MSSASAAVQRPRKTGQLSVHGPLSPESTHAVSAASSNRWYSRESCCGAPPAWCRAMSTWSYSFQRSSSTTGTSQPRAFNAVAAVSRWRASVPERTCANSTPRRFSSAPTTVDCSKPSGDNAS